jgi:DNA (cytosine-5)-methyltransferase 1
MDIGFESAGFRVVWTNEVSATYAQMYSHGMTLWRRSRKRHARRVCISAVGPLQRIGARRILREAFANRRPSLFGVIGGPPCPDFSIAGKNGGGRGRHGRLSGIFVERICELKPAFFVFENVAGLCRMKRHRAYLRGLERKLEAHGYSIDHRVLNALELGVPQDRERLVVVGIRSAIVRKWAGRRVSTSERDWFPWPWRREYLAAKEDFSWPRMAKRGSSVRLPRGVPYELTVASAFRKGRRPWCLPNGRDAFKPRSKRFKTAIEGDTKGKSFKRLHRYRYSPTACYGHREVHIHPWNDRRLTVREAMRLQGIPDAYALPADVSLGEKFAVVSNGVPVPLAQAVAERLRGFLGSVR